MTHHYVNPEPFDPAEAERLTPEQDRGGAGFPEAADGRHERRLAFGVEMGVGLVQHDQARLAKDGSCEPNPLALAARERCPAIRELGLVTLR